MIRAVYQLTKPDDAGASLTLTMTVGEWKQVRATLNKAGDYPGWRVAEIIGELVGRAAAHFDASSETERP